MSMLRMTRALTRSSLTHSKTLQCRYLHYTPGPQRERPAVKEPQELHHFFEYRYVPDTYPEVFGEAVYPKNNPYNIAPMYDWDNYLPKEYNEYLSLAPVWVYLTVGLIYFWIGLWGFVHYIDHKHFKETGYEPVDISAGQGYFNNLV